MLFGMGGGIGHKTSSRLDVVGVSVDVDVCFGVDLIVDELTGLHVAASVQVRAVSQ